MKNKTMKGVVLGLVFSLLTVAQAGAQAVPTMSRRPATAGKPTSTPVVGKTQSCERIEAAVEVRMASLVRLADTMREKFESISTRTQDFYAEKVVPTGVSVPGYDGLVAEIASKSAVVETELDKASADVTAFSCDSGEIRDLLSDFRMDMQTVKRALHDYRTAIKNLIVAVHTALGEAEVTPTPTTGG